MTEASFVLYELGLIRLPLPRIGGLARDVSIDAYSSSGELPTSFRAGGPIKLAYKQPIRTPRTICGLASRLCCTAAFPRAHHRQLNKTLDIRATMHRQAVHTALGRGSLAIDSCRVASTVTAQCRGRQTFSTSVSRRNDDDSKPKDAATNNENGRPRSHERSKAAASAIRKLNTSPRAPGDALRSTGSIDARSLGNMINTIFAESPRVIRIQKSPEKLASGSRTGIRKAVVEPPPGGLRARFPQRISQVTEGVQAPEGSQFKIVRIPTRSQANNVNVPARLQGGGGFRATGRGTRPVGGRFVPGRGRKSAVGKRERKPKAVEASGGKMRFTAAEKEVMDRIDQGEVTEYKPHVTLDDLEGYGPAVASDSPFGKIESAMQAMRIMGGGAAFNSDLSPTMDYEGAYKRYIREKKPVFFNSAAEKAWVHSAWGGFTVSKPSVVTTDAIIDLTIRGKYEDTTSFVDLSDTKATVANYHSQTFSYRPSDSKAFIDKLEALLPAEQKP